jgi:ribosomal protein L30E
MSERPSKRARLVLISRTASQGTKDKILHKAEFYGVEAAVINIDSSELGRLLGKLYAPATVAIIDDRFAEEIRQAIKTNDGNSESSD